MVIFFHFFYINAAPFNKTDIYPYGDTFANLGVFEYGVLGVPLFFIISGFVIALTLNSCSGPVEFAVRRFARLWPALIFWSIVTSLALRLSASSFAAGIDPRIVDFVPSWTLTPPPLWAPILPGARYVDGVYWSLVVEIRLYFFAALLYWTLGASNFARNLAIFTVLVVAARVLVKAVSPELADLFTAVFVPTELPWFASGAIFFELYRGRIRDGIALLMLLPMYGLIVRFSVPTEHYSRAAMLLIVLCFFLMFWAIAKGLWITRYLENRALVLVGFCSYSIYLFHNYIGTALISVIPKQLSLIESTSLVCGIILLMIGVGYLSFVAIENPMRRLVVERLLPNKKVRKAA